MNTMATSMNRCLADMKPKTSKHLMERKRRARINDSLLQLKSLVFPTVRKEIARHPKLEKADILEMTVRHIQELQRPTTTGSNNVSQFHAGFSECLSEVSQFLSNCENVELDTRLRILNHLADKCSTMPEPAAAASEPRHAPSSPVQHQQPMTTSSSPVHHPHHRRSQVQRHSPYGYQMEARRQGASHTHTAELRVPPVNPRPQDSLVVVIPPPMDKYTTSHTVYASKVSPNMDMYPTPPQSPVEDTHATANPHFTSVVHHQQHQIQLQQQTRVPSPHSLPARQPIHVQEPVWRPW